MTHHPAQANGLTLVFEGVGNASGTDRGGFGYWAKVLSQSGVVARLPVYHEFNHLGCRSVGTSKASVFGNILFMHLLI